jgi:hypothetical protein
VSCSLVTFTNGLNVHVAYRTFCVTTVMCIYVYILRNPIVVTHYNFLFCCCNRFLLESSLLRHILRRSVESHVVAVNVHALCHSTILISHKRR